MFILSWKVISKKDCENATIARKNKKKIKAILNALDFMFCLINGRCFINLAAN